MYANGQEVLFVAPSHRYKYMASRFTIYSINQISDIIYQISYIIYKISQISYINKISYMSIKISYMLYTYISDMLYKIS